jgi:GDPmannose 4,6-dehydratase
MWRILQHKNADDFVLATGETHTVKEFTGTAFKELGIELEWRGKGKNEKGVIKKVNLDIAKSLIDYNNSVNQYKLGIANKLRKDMIVVTIDPNYYRPTEVEYLIGNPAKAKKLLGWKAKTRFNELVKIMIKSDLNKVLIRGY